MRKFVPTVRVSRAALIFLVAALIGIGAHASSRGLAVSAPTQSTLISQGQSTYATGTVVYPVSNMVDSTYDEYRCTPTCAGVIHFTTAPSTSAIISWYNDDNDFWASVPFLGDTNYNMPKNFTIDGCSSACTGTPPTSGWTNLETVTNNLFNSGQYAVSLATACGGSPCTWLRMDVTASSGSSGNTDASWHLDVTACASTCAANTDAWLFLGDSITNNSMWHTPTSPPNFMQTVNSGNASYYPSEIEGGVSFSKACDWLGLTTQCPDGEPSSPSMITTVLSSFPAAHYVTINLGTNDLNGTGHSWPNTASNNYEANMTALVQDVINAGMVPVVPTVPWAPTSCDGSAALTDNDPTVSGTPNYWIVNTLYANFPEVVHGPDLWTYFDTHQSLINTSNCPHPTTAGQWDYRTLWANTMVSNVYAALANPVPTVTLTATPTQTLTKTTGNSSSILTWSSSNATTCSASASPADATWSGSVALSNNSPGVSITPSATTTYTLSCNGSGGTTPATAVVTVCKVADLNCDGTVNIYDLSTLLTDYATTVATADVNNDGVVNVFDLSILLTRYGT